jgi:hypothetical protein
MNKLQTIQQIVSDHGHEIIFREPVTIKLGPHQGSFECYGIHSENGVWLMDGAGEWHGPLEENQCNATAIINSLYQRLLAMKMEAA